jgi:glycosyltransferase involved in cell wall biosynthesis
MKVAVDASPILHRDAGIRHYASRLVREIPGAAPDVELLLTVNAWKDRTWRELSARASAECPGAALHRTRLPSRLDSLFGHRLLIPWQRRALRRLRPDLLFCPNFVGPCDPAYPTVLTVHDLAFRVLPHVCVDRTRAALERLLPGCLELAAAVVVPSRSTERDLLREYGVRPEKVFVVAEGVEPAFRPLEDPERRSDLARRWSLPPRYLLAVGTVEPRKNLATLLRAMDVLRERGASWPLLVAGGRGWKSEALYREWEERGLTEAVRFLGRVPHEDLPGLYSLADLFVYPSLYEGFGLPLLEAMACGTPVLSTAVSSIPEVAGDAGHLVEEPEDADALADAIGRLMEDEDARRTLSARGRERAREFTWRRAAEETVRVFRGVARGET